MKKEKTYNKVERENEMLHALFDFATEGIIICDQQGEIVKINNRASAMFGYSSDDLLGNKIEVLIPDRFSNRHTKNRTTYSAHPQPRSMGKGIELFAKRKDGHEFPVEVSLSPFKTADGYFIMSFVIDITERKMHEQKLHDTNEQLKEKSDEILRLNEHLESKVKDRTRELANAIRELAESKNEVMKALDKEKQLNELKSRFVTTASHEFRTPLGTILSSASLIGKYVTNDDQDKREKHIGRIKSAVNNLTEILNDFLSLDRLEEGAIRNNPVEFKIDEFVRTICDELSSILKPGQKLLCDFGGNQDTVIIDQQLLKNVLINLISNAIKYSEEHKVIKVASTVRDSVLTIEIMDEGNGIPHEDQPYIFDRFYRANNCGNIQGTGLGLNIVKKYVELLNGKIYFKSEPGVGSTFTVSIAY